MVSQNGARRRHAPRAALLTALLPALWQGFAPIALSQPAVEPVSLDEVLIQATRTRIAAFDYPGSVSSVSMDALQTIGATHSSEALNRVPGAFLQRGSGQEVLVALRSPVLTGPGACGAILLMEDGLPLRPVGSCNVNELFEVNLEQAASVEVLRGPGLGPQGANALHGLVNVRSVALDTPWRAGLELGQNDYTRLKLQGSTVLGGGRLAFAGHTTHDGGWRTDTGIDEQKLNLKWGARLGDGQLTLSLAGTTLDQDTGGFINGLATPPSPGPMPTLKLSGRQAPCACSHAGKQRPPRAGRPPSLHAPRVCVFCSTSCLASPSSATASRAQASPSAGVWISGVAVGGLASMPNRQTVISSRRKAAPLWKGRQQRVASVPPVGTMTTRSACTRLRHG